MDASGIPEWPSLGVLYLAYPYIITQSPKASILEKVHGLSSSFALFNSVVKLVCERCGREMRVAWNEDRASCTK